MKLRESKSLRKMYGNEFEINNGIGCSVQLKICNTYWKDNKPKTIILIAFDLSKTIKMIALCLQTLISMI